MKIDIEPKLDFDDVLLMPQRTTLTSRKEVNISREFKFYHSPKIWNGTPVMCANMSFASFRLAEELAKYKIITCLHKYHTEKQIEFFFGDRQGSIDYNWVSIGYDKKWLDFVRKFKDYELNYCIDVPNGQMDDFVDYCKLIRQRSPKSIIMAGNVTDPSSTQELIIHGGVDIVKIGIGPGSACTTRMVTGCGYPQLSACIDNSYVAHGLKSADRKLGLICSDGGCKTTGDIVKAFGAGADFVMMGGYFAGVNECDGEWDHSLKHADDWGKDLVTFSYYGMSTHKSQEDNAEGKKAYRASEGTKITVARKGPAEDLVSEMLGGIRSACTYIGATSIKDMPKCASFCKVNRIHTNNNPILGV